VEAGQASSRSRRLDCDAAATAAAPRRSPPQLPLAPARNVLQAARSTSGGHDRHVMWLHVRRRAPGLAAAGRGGRAAAGPPRAAAALRRRRLPSVPGAVGAVHFCAQLLHFCAQLMHFCAQLSCRGLRAARVGGRGLRERRQPCRQRGDRGARAAPVPQQVPRRRRHRHPPAPDGARKVVCQRRHLRPPRRAASLDPPLAPAPARVPAGTGRRRLRGGGGGVRGGARARLAVEEEEERAQLSLRGGPERQRVVYAPRADERGVERARAVAREEEQA
jgi:hypothetical protein